MSSILSVSKLGRIALLAVSALLAQPVFAHAHLKAQDPTAGTTVDVAPKMIELKFTEDVEPAFSGIVLTGAKNASIQLGAPKVDSKDPAHLIIPVKGTMPAGSYQVNWHAVSVDGHKSKGDYTFNVK
ncbi:MAG: copper homeostasis periplasmic binding protein CopC [Paralcaligenes sp.]